MSRLPVAALVVFMVVTTLATAIFVPMLYIAGFEKISLLRIVPVELARWAPIGLIGYVALNILMYAVGSGGNRLYYWVTYIASVFAWISITATSAFVFIGWYSSYPDLMKVLDLPWTAWVLPALFVFAWIDVLYLQGDKYEPAKQWIAAVHSVAAPMPPAPGQYATPQPAFAPQGGRPVSGKAILVSVLVVTFIGWLVFGYPDIFGVRYNMGWKLGPDRPVTPDTTAVRISPAPSKSTAYVMPTPAHIASRVPHRTTYACVPCVQSYTQNPKTCECSRVTWHPGPPPQ